MKNILLSTAALVGLTAGAVAADLPVRAAPPPPVAVAPVFTWTGFYAGVNLGWAWDGEDAGQRGRLVTAAPGGGTFSVRTRGGGSFLGRRDNGDSDGGLVGGGQIGYNMQFGMFVAGIEADAQAIDLGDVSGDRLPRGARTAALRGGLFAPRFGIAPVAGGGGNVFFRGNGFDDNGDDVNGFGTVRGRLGVAFDRMMVYATGGLAYKFGGDDGGNGRAGRPGAAFFSPLSPGAAARGARVLNRIGNGNGDGDDSDLGFTVGGGVEYAFTNNLSAKIEGLYVDFSNDGGRNGNVVGVTNTGRAIRLTGRNGGDAGQGEFALVRAGLNFRFGTW
ncbi:MAG TPA: porin family protein [Microvirga sp.]|jgi:outer membrane immunogenic protein|nr:porin family protein [Microvirga sp.]